MKRAIGVLFLAILGLSVAGLGLSNHIDEKLEDNARELKEMKAQMEFQEVRIMRLEKVCHGQCANGDADCATRCQKAGHCDRMSQ